MLCRNLIGLFIFIAVLHVAPVSAEERAVRAEGIAVKGKVDAITKAKALDKAMEDAVRKVVLSMLSDSVYEDNKKYIDSRIIRRAKKYVINYRITANGWVTHLDMVGMDSGNRLDDVLLSDGGSGMGHDILSDVDSGADLEKNGPFIKSMSEGVVAYHVWINAGVDVAMLKKPISSLTTIDNSKTVTVSIVMLDLSSFDQYNLLLKKLKKVDLVKAVNYRSFSNERYVVEAESSVSTQELWEKLSSTLGSEYIVVPSGLDSIIIKAASK